MTVVVGFVGSDGAVMASDSQASENDHTKYDVTKIWEDSGLLFGYSGNTAVRAPIQHAIAERLAKGIDTHTSRWNIKAVLREQVGKVLTKEYAQWVPAPPQGQVPAALSGSLLVIGHDADGFWLLDIDYNNTGTFHPERDFHAIGSGSAAAQLSRGLLEHYEPEARTVKHLKLIAFRTVHTCIRFLDAGVGGAVQMWTSETEAGCTEVADDELERITHGVEQWTIIEKESLDEVMGESPSSPAEARATEMPEVLGDGGRDVEAPAAGGDAPSPPASAPAS